MTKTFAPESIQEGWEAGLRVFGENRVQEAEPKVLWFRERERQLEWHMVGHLQRNKAKKAIDLFDVIQSVDSVRLAREISKRCQAAQDPSLETMHAPTGSSGVQDTPKSGHSGGSRIPLSTSPHRHPPGSSGSGVSTEILEAS